MATIVQEDYGYKFISVSDLLREEAEARHLVPSRDVLHDISSEWRKKEGLGVLVDKAVVEFEEIKDSYKGLIISSLRNPGEADRVHQYGGVVVWVDADPEIRFARIQYANRGRKETDDKTFEEFVEDEKKEWSNKGQHSRLDLGGVKEKSDITIFNNSTEMQYFIQTIRKSLKQYLG